MVVPVDTKRANEEKLHANLESPLAMSFLESEQSWRIPRPALVISDGFHFDDTWDVESMAQTRASMNTPTSFTLLSHPGINGSCRGPSPFQLVFTVCSLLLLGIIGAIVYMEAYMNRWDH